MKTWSSEHLVREDILGCMGVPSNVERIDQRLRRLKQDLEPMERVQQRAPDLCWEDSDNVQIHSVINMLRNEIAALEYSRSIAADAVASQTCFGRFKGAIRATRARVSRLRPPSKLCEPSRQDPEATHLVHSQRHLWKGSAAFAASSEFAFSTASTASLDSRVSGEGAERKVVTISDFEYVDILC
jgi:hypothetical protein